MADENDDSPSAGDSPPPLAPVGQGAYVVAPGDCMANIATAAGFFWETLWNHGDNSELKTKRKNPNVLLPGDQVTIPAIATKSESKATGSSYKFKRKGVPLKLNLQFLDECRKPRANLHYILYAGPQTLEGNTDGDGFIRVSIPPDLTSARVALNNGKEIHDFNLGNTDPIDDLRALQSRLFNLAFYTGPLDAQMSPALQQALQDFQSAYNLQASGKIDDATKQKILSIHGS